MSLALEEISQSQIQPELNFSSTGQIDPLIRSRLQTTIGELSSALSKMQDMLSMQDQPRVSHLHTSLTFQFDPSDVENQDEQSLASLCQVVCSLSSEVNGSLTHLGLNVDRQLAEYRADLQSYEKKLDEHESASRRLKTLLHVLPAGVVLIDGRGVIQQCNAAAIDLLGEPLEGEKWLDVIQRCFAPRKDDGHEVSLKDGRKVSIAIRSIDKEPGQLILLTDLTETRDLQFRLNRYERLSAMGRMVASLAHQIRTPLSAAMLYAGHLSEVDLDDALRIKCAGRLKSRLVHLEQQVRDMLIFAKGETPTAEKLSVAELMHRLRQAVEPIVNRGGVSVDWSNNVSGRHLLCNREALIGACMNLINNSMEAAPGEINIRVSFRPDGADQFCIAIADNGPGFSNQEPSRLKEAFYTTKPQGTGLGLAVVQAVAKAHKGSFELSSLPEGGASAEITLPLNLDDNEPVRQTMERDTLCGDAL